MNHRQSVPFDLRMSWSATTLRRGFVLTAAAWAVALPLATFAAGRPHASSIVYGFALAAYGIGNIVCHQLPERSFHLWSAQMPVCARCTGVYGGAAIAALLASVTALPKRRSTFRMVSIASAFVGHRFGGVRFSRADRRLALVAAALPTVATLVYEWTTGHVPSNGIRFAAGFPIGAVVSWLAVRTSLS